MALLQKNTHYKRLKKRPKIMNRGSPTYSPPRATRRRRAPSSDDDRGVSPPRGYRDRYYRGAVSPPSRSTGSADRSRASRSSPGYSPPPTSNSQVRKSAK